MPKTNITKKGIGKKRLGIRKKMGKPKSATPQNRRKLKKKNNERKVLSLEEEALRASPDMTRLLNENKGNLFVPNDFKEEAALAESAEAAALAAQVKRREEIYQTLKNMQDRYGGPLTEEHALSTVENIRSSRPPIFDFGSFDEDLKKEKEAELDINLAFDSNMKLDRGYDSGKGGKRKSRKKKSLRKRRRRRKRRKTKRKSRRRRK